MDSDEPHDPTTDLEDPVREAMLRGEQARPVHRRRVRQADQVVLPERGQPAGPAQRYR